MTPESADIQPVGAGLSRDISKGEAVEADLDLLRPRLRGVGEGARPGEKAHGPIVEIRVELWKGLEVEMSEKLTDMVVRPAADHYTLPITQEVEDEITEQRSIGVTAHVRSGVS